MIKNHNINYEDIARIQIDTAIDLYNENNFISAITLAGASEGITGQALINIGIQPVLHELAEKISKQSNLPVKDVIFKLNLTRNGFKHLVEEICEEHIDIELQARVEIMRAVSNYCKLSNHKTCNMDKFLTTFEKLTDAA